MSTGNIIFTKSGRRRDMTVPIDNLFTRKFGRKWRQRMRNKDIPLEELEAARAEFDKLMEDAKDDKR